MDIDAATSSLSTGFNCLVKNIHGIEELWGYPRVLLHIGGFIGLGWRFGISSVVASTVLSTVELEHACTNSLDKGGWDIDSIR